MPYSYKIIQEIKSTPDKIYDLEKELHKRHSDFKYKPKIYFPGSIKECFSTYIE